MVAYDFDLRCERTSKTEVLFALNQMLIDRANQGRNTVLIVDEAHNLDWEVLEEIRLLGNLENRRGKLLQIILAGQQELDRKMEAPEYRQLKQRIALRCVLKPLECRRASTTSIPAWRVAGMKDQECLPAGDPGGDSLPGTGHSASDQRYCDNLLLTAFAMESKVATMEMLDEVTNDMRLDYPG